MTWKELKDFCNGLSEGELEKNIVLWRESEAITDITAEQLAEDHYVEDGNEEDGCFSETESESKHHDDPEFYPKGMGHFRKVYKAGHPILHENF